MLELDAFVDDVIRQQIDDILTGVDREISKHYVAKIDVRIASHIAITKVKRLVDLSVYSHDGKINNYSFDPVLEICEPNGEPAPITIDPWARGTVSVKKIEVVPIDLFHQRGSGAHSPGSVSSVPSIASSSVGSYSSRSNNSRRLSSRSIDSKTPHTKISNDPTGKIFSIDDDRFGTEDTSINQELNRIISKLRSNTLNGSKTSKTMAKTTVPIDKPSISQSPVSVFDEKKEENISKSINSRKISKISSPVNKISKKTQPSTTQSSTIQPKNISKTITDPKSILSIHQPTLDSIQKEMNMLENLNKKKKPSVNNDFNKNIHRMNQSLTTSKLMSTIQGEASIATSDSSSIPNAVVKQPIIPSSSPIRNGNRKGSNNATRLSQLLKPSVSPVKKSEETTKSLISMQLLSSSSSSTTSGLIDDMMGFNHSSILLPESMQPELLFDDLDAFVGGRKTVNNINTNSDNDDNNDNNNDGDGLQEKDDDFLGPKTTSGHFDLSTTPVKPSIRQISEARRMFGAGLRPKDRDYINNMKSTSERKKLPPPPLGQTTGHGVILASSSINTIDRGFKDSSFLSNSVHDVQTFHQEPLSVGNRSTQPVGGNTDGIIKVARSIAL